ncbi:hypothetical protein JCM8547_003206 [Rhodosporidiobolus lusitaniae]
MPIRTEAPPELFNPGLVLLWGNSPNGWKCTYLLQALKETGAIPDYTAVDVDLQNGEQFQPWFVAVNPNSKMPALIDNRQGMKPINVWESASILLYLTKTYDTKGEFWFANDEDLQTELVNWLFFTQSNVGPQQGQTNHFYRYSGQKIDYAIERFTTETYRLYQVLDDHLSGAKDAVKKEWIVGGKATTADFCCQPWIRCHFWGGLSLDAYPSLAAWVHRVESLPYVKNALTVPKQDLVTIIKANPDIERQIMERMKAQREENERKKREEAEGAAGTGAGEGEGAEGK